MTVRSGVQLCLEEISGRYELRILRTAHLCFLSHSESVHAQKTQKDKYGRISEICRIGQILESEVKNGREYL